MPLEKEAANIQVFHSFRSTNRGDSFFPNFLFSNFHMMHLCLFHYILPPYSLIQSSSLGYTFKYFFFSGVEHISLHRHNQSFMLNLLGIFGLVMEQFSRSKTSALVGVKHPHDLHSWALRSVYY